MFTLKEPLLHLHISVVAGSGSKNYFLLLLKGIMIYFEKDDTKSK